MLRSLDQFLYLQYDPLLLVLRDFAVKASGDSFEIGDGRILIYSSIGVQNSIF